MCIALWFYKWKINGNVWVVLYLGRVRCIKNLSNLLALYSGFMADLAKCNVDHFKMG